MRFTHLGRYALAFTLSVGLAACGSDDDPTGNDGDELTEAEAEVMMEALVEAGGFGFTSFGGGPAAIFAAPQTFPVNETENCPAGGAIQVQGQVTFDDVAETLAVDLTQTHQACASTASSNNSTWTFNGSPNIAIDFNLEGTSTGFTMDGTQKGAVAWSSGGKNGTCQIDLTWDFTGSEDGSTFSGSVNGSVCGHAVSETVEITDPAG